MLINRRRFSLGALASAGVMAGCVPAETRQARSAPKNFMLMIIDDLNDWITALGDHPQVKTPHIDALAASGTVFSNAHAQAPICGPSRASMFSGLFPAQTGIYGQISDDILARHRDGLALVRTGIGVQRAVRVQDINHRQIASPGNFIVVCIVGRGHLHTAASQLRFRPRISHQRNLAAEQRQS